LFLRVELSSKIVIELLFDKYLKQDFPESPKP